MDVEPGGFRLRGELGVANKVYDGLRLISASAESTGEQTCHLD